MSPPYLDNSLPCVVLFFKYIYISFLITFQFTSVLPTALVADSSNRASDSRRTGIIAGATSGLFVLLLLLLGGVFAWRRHRLKSQPGSGKKEVRALLEGEEFDDDDVVPMSMRHQRQISTNSPYNQYSVDSSAPSLLKSRTSESGSIFREEVWPPPGFVDPIQKRSSQVDLSKIVDDVMGPSQAGSSQVEFGSSSSSDHHTGPPSSWHNNNHNRDLTDATVNTAHSDLSINSSTSLRRTSYGNDPFQPAFVTSPVTYQSPSLPPGASAPHPPGSSRSTSPTPPSHSHNRSSTSHSLPKKSSPLARALTQDAKNIAW